MSLFSPANLLVIRSVIMIDIVRGSTFVRTPGEAEFYSQGSTGRTYHAYPVRNLRGSFVGTQGSRICLWAFFWFWGRFSGLGVLGLNTS